MNMILQLKSRILLLLLSIVFASDLVVIKFGISGNPPLILAGLRYLFAGLILSLITVTMPKSRSISQRNLLNAVFLGALATIEFACLYVGMQYISAGETSILYYTHPIFVAALATVFLKESFSWKKASALLLGFVGIVLLFLENLSTSLVSIGGFLVLSSALCWALGIILFKKLVGNENFLPVTSTFLLSAGAFLLALSIFSEATLVVSLQFVLILTYLVVICTAFGVALYYYLLRHHEASQVSMWLFLVPVFGVLLGWLLLGEKVDLNEVIGILFVGIGIVVLNK